MEETNSEQAKRKGQAFNMEVEAATDGRQFMESFWSKMVEIIEETLNWFATNIDSYPSMELEEEEMSNGTK